MSRMLFVNLPVADIPASRAFFDSLGFSFDEKFSDESAACMVISDQAFVMLLQRTYFETFIDKPIADAQQATALIAAISAESRDAVDDFVEQALAGGATSAKDPQDLGFMYQRSFHDLDGHLWEVIWMDPAAAEQGPPAEAA